MLHEVEKFVECSSQWGAILPPTLDLFMAECHETESLLLKRFLSRPKYIDTEGVRQTRCSPFGRRESRFLAQSTTASKPSSCCAMMAGGAKSSLQRPKSLLRSSCAVARPIACPSQSPARLLQQVSGECYKYNHNITTIFQVHPMLNLAV